MTFQDAAGLKGQRNPVIAVRTLVKNHAGKDITHARCHSRERMRALMMVARHSTDREREEWRAIPARILARILFQNTVV
jgi:hypothetical protein